jgi:PAS domain-containing protein
MLDHHCPAEPLLHEMHAAMLIIEPLADRILLANPTCCRLLDCSLDDLLGQRASRLWAHAPDALLAFTEEAQERGLAWSDRLDILGRDGQQLNVDISASLLPHPAGPRLGLLIRPRRNSQAETERNEHQRLLESPGVERIFHQFERQNQLILGAAGEGIYGVNRAGETTFVNPAAERILGWRAEDLIGHNIHDLIHHHHPDGSLYEGHTCPIYAAFNDGEVHQHATA